MSSSNPDSSTQRTPLWSRPGYLVRRLHQIHSAIFLEECEEFELTPVQYGLLTTLLYRPDLDQKTLGMELGLDRTNVADVLVRLSKRGLLTRQRSSTDRRMVLARLTPKGEKITHQMHAAMQRAQDRMVAPLNTRERETLLDLLIRLVDANNQYGRAAYDPR